MRVISADAENIGFLNFANTPKTAAIESSDRRRRVEEMDVDVFLKFPALSNLKIGKISASCKFDHKKVAYVLSRVKESISIDWDLFNAFVLNPKIERLWYVFWRTVYKHTEIRVATKTFTLTDAPWNYVMWEGSIMRELRVNCQIVSENFVVLFDPNIKDELYDTTMYACLNLYLRSLPVNTKLFWYNVPRYIMETRPITTLWYSFSPGGSG